MQHDENIKVLVVLTFMSYYEIYKKRRDTRLDIPSLNMYMLMRLFYLRNLSRKHQCVGAVLADS